MSTPLLTSLTLLGAERRAVDARCVEAAGELAALSDSALGSSGVARRAGFARPALMLAEVWQIPVGEAVRFCEVGLAIRGRVALDGSELPAAYPSVGAAVRSGALSVAVAGVIVRELTAASPRISTAARLHAESELVRHAPGLTVAEVHTLARHARDFLDQDGPEHRDDLRRSRRSLRFTTTSGGMVRLEWEMPPETGGLVKAAIDALVAEQLRAARDGGVGRAEAPSGRDPDGSSDGSIPDDRTLPQRRSDAAEQLFHHVMTCDGPGGDRPAVTMVVRVSLDNLRAGAGAGVGAGAGTGAGIATASIDGIDETISISTARILAANAGIIPVVLGGEGEVLDLGRSRRLFSKAQRLALIERDDGCAYPACSSPPAYAEAHHIDWWSAGGDTDLSNGVMLCSFHHHRIHDDGWDIDVQNQVPYFIPPPWVDPDRTPRRGGRVSIPVPA